jgi:sugar/nucleoside kinase (ribokinase family)
MKTYDVFGIGSPLMDTLIYVDDFDLLDLKLKKGTMHLVDDSHIAFFKKVLSNKKTIEKAGGSVSNTIAGISNLGGKAFFNGKIGRDKLGFDYEMMMNHQGVVCDLKKDNFSNTGNVLALVTKDSERTFATYLGSAINFEKRDVNKAELLKSKILHLEGYMLEHSPQKEAAIYAMDIAKRNNIIVSVDLSDASLIKRNLNEFRKIVKKYVNILFLNEKEAEAFTGLNDPKKALIEASRYVNLAIVKIGKEGSMLKIRKRILIFKPFPSSKVIDTTGAGDMYAAGILYAISNGLSLEEAGKIASYASTKVVEQIGARLNFSLRDKIKDLY